MEAYSDQEAVGCEDRWRCPFSLPTVQGASLGIADPAAVQSEAFVLGTLCVRLEEAKPALLAEVVLARLSVVAPSALWPPASCLSLAHSANVGPRARETGSRISEIPAARLLLLNS